MLKTLCKNSKNIWARQKKSSNHKKHKFDMFPSIKGHNFRIEQNMACILWCLTICLIFQMIYLWGT